MSKANKSKVIGEPLWYKDAVIYELHVRAFYDSKMDGYGDFNGLTKKLDYLSDLGISAIWLLPFYPSPLKDDGYDIADYMSIHPMYGSLEDFQNFLNAAHDRKIKVITELVLNHTSDQHEWFQKSRLAKAGRGHADYKDFYVWTDNPNKYREVRIIFKDFETSNWAWDPIAKSYYWHRFFSHQPDLNYDNPVVKEKMYEVLDFWLGMGVDGLRLDAIPYLFEREGTSSENLPETHAFLRDIRKHIDQKFYGRVLLSEANQWPEDAVQYFGSGDESQMCFHFPVMPRLFMALRLEDRFSIVDILRQTPDIPSHCQWAIFLRNHDELTLEMVTDEERDYMYRMYAMDTKARINLGIRRRLAPLLGNDRRQIELLNALLFSLPGTPVIYYGDEIGMGDNIFLGDRNGVRTPFQWSPDRNAGFSHVNPQQLYLPVIVAPDYHYETVNVENEQANPNSLLWWMKNIIAKRKQYQVFGRGSIEFLEPENTKVLSFLRILKAEHADQDEQIVLVVANLSRKTQFAELNLSRFKGYTPIELFGHVQFPVIGDNPYMLTMSPYAFYWFALASHDQATSTRPTLISTAVSSVEIEREPLQEIGEYDVAPKIEADLCVYLPKMRWFASKSRHIIECQLEDYVLLNPSSLKTAKYVLACIKVLFDDGPEEQYLVALGYATGERAEYLKKNAPQTIISENVLFVKDESEGVYFEATAEADFFKELLTFILTKQKTKGHLGTLFADLYAKLTPDQLKKLPNPEFRGFEQSNSAISYENDFFLKLFRKLDFGVNPELELIRYLCQKGFSNIPQIVGAIEYSYNQQIRTLGVLTTYVPSASDAFVYTTEHVTKYLEEVLALTAKDFPSESPSILKPSFLFDLPDQKPPEYLSNSAGHYLGSITLLGKRLSELHEALGGDDSHPTFVAEEFTPFYQRALYQSLRNLAEHVFWSLKKMKGKAAEPHSLLINKVISLESQVYSIVSGLKGKLIYGKRIRCHGDLHLGQILFTGNDFIFLDFEGEPSKSISERNLKRSPLKDVVGMLRSFDYASRFVEKQRHARTEDNDKEHRLLREWSFWAQKTFLRSYLLNIEKSELIPKETSDQHMLTTILLIEKVLYEIDYEMNNRPNWLDIPLNGLIDIIGV